MITDLPNRVRIYSQKSVFNIYALLDVIAVINSQLNFLAMVERFLTSFNIPAARELPFDDNSFCPEDSSETASRNGTKWDWERSSGRATRNRQLSRFGVILPDSRLALAAVDASLAHDFDRR